MTRASTSCSSSALASMRSNQEIVESAPQPGPDDHREDARSNQEIVERMYAEPSGSKLAERSNQEIVESEQRRNLVAVFGARSNQEIVESDTSANAPTHVKERA